MRISKIHRFHPIPSKGCAVVIDVIRAFTTAAFAFAQGAKEIILVGKVSEALELHKKFPQAFLLGEEESFPVPEFHYGNSPIEITKQNLNGKTLIMRTSSGTQGIVAAQNADHILAASFVVAQATIQRILKLQPECVNFVITGYKMGGEEDKALADYLEAKLLGQKVNSASYLKRVAESASAQAFLSGRYSHLPAHDIPAVLEIDRFPFAMEVFKENNLLILRPLIA